MLTFASLMDGLLKEAIGLGRLEDDSNLLDDAVSATRDLGDALLACRDHKKTYTLF